MSLLTPAISLPGLKQPHCLEADIDNCKKPSTLQLAVFCGAPYVLAVGTGGTKPNISMIGPDQFDNLGPREKAHKHSFKWLMFSIFMGTLLANTALYIQDTVLGPLVRAPDPRARDLDSGLPRRDPFLLPPGACGQPAHEDGAGHRGPREEVEGAGPE
ncbi:hypothetical protein ACJRO7_031761 [Eucalyptus globulus]|uniref:Uncharacterized protein n=1 Tax=Eucalyptus globulus TaxID=34317 RepID=A0ABD3JL56_EUCGL